MVAACTKDEGKPGNREGLARYPAFKPYRGKLAVRNFRGGDGDVGIIRSPVRAIALPDSHDVSVGLAALRDALDHGVKTPAKLRVIDPAQGVPRRHQEAAGVRASKVFLPKL
jgi:hypothetical protein